ncbi:hypothetical protein BDZ91DRAFT_835540 [Kalaharituber pfeilii]|nr:hypothetical protein BDZ91DRAFT_835540 [Kalaharituber pfeilii]
MSFNRVGRRLGPRWSVILPIPKEVLVLGATVSCKGTNRALEVQPWVGHALRKLTPTRTQAHRCLTSSLRVGEWVSKSTALQFCIQGEDTLEKLTAIAGPYGWGYDLTEFGTVVFFATGIGIAAVLPYIKSLAQKRDNREAKTQEISLVWILEKNYWVADWMQPVIRNDATYMTNIHIYVLERITNRKQVGTHKLFCIDYEQPDIGKLVQEFIDKRKSGLAIGVCAYLDVKSVCECKVYKISGM